MIVKKKKNKKYGDRIHEIGHKTHKEYKKEKENEIITRKSSITR